MPIATAMLLDASHTAHPMPDPTIALTITAMASERIDGLLFGSCSTVCVPSIC